MLRLTLLWRARAQLALGLFELDRIEQLSALVALITTCVVIVTLRTDTICLLYTSDAADDMPYV